MESEFLLMLDPNTSEPIYHVDGTVLVERSDGYQFYVDPATLSMEVEPPTLTPESQHWTREQVLKLINAYVHNKENFASSAIKNVKVWQTISNILGTHSAKQCENKFKYLKAKYLKKKDNMSDKQSGAARIQFSFFEEMDAIFGKQPIVDPIIASSSRENTFDGTEEETIPDPLPQQVEPRRKEKNTKNVKLRDAITSLNSTLKDSEDKKEKRFKELLDLQKESLNTFQHLMERFLEKM